MKTYAPAFLQSLTRAQLRRALWLTRRQAARPDEINPAAAQYDGLATPASVRAEYRRRGWKVRHFDVAPDAIKRDLGPYLVPALRAVADELLKEASL